MVLLLLLNLCHWVGVEWLKISLSYLFGVDDGSHLGYPWKIVFLDSSIEDMVAINNETEEI